MQIIKNMLFSGQLVKINQGIYEKINQLGIIIECTYPEFSHYGSDKWLVLVEGNLEIIEGLYLWPHSLEEDTYEI